jgi:hypothetical protein
LPSSSAVCHAARTRRGRIKNETAIGVWRLIGDTRRSHSRRSAASGVAVDEDVRVVVVVVGGGGCSSFGVVLGPARR